MARILVIDDEPNVRTLVEQTLTDAGHEVFLAEHGRQGLTFFRAEPVDLIVTDIYMPEMEGLEFINTFRKQYPQIPIIAMSGNPDLSIALKVAGKLGAVVTLSKPFRPEELRAAVRSALKDKADTYEI